MLLAALQLHILADIGSFKFQVGYISEQNIGNQIEIYLNSQSSRYTPTVVSLYAGQFFVGEYALQQASTDNTIVFRNFFYNERQTTLQDSVSDRTITYGGFVQCDSLLLFSAIINHIAQNFVKELYPNETVYVSLLHYSGMKLPYIAYYYQVIESYPNFRLFMTVPISNAVVAAHLMNRKRELFQSNQTYFFVVIDVGSYQTELSLIQVTTSPYTLSVYNSVLLSRLINVGGDHLSECMYYDIKARIYGAKKNITVQQRYQLYTSIEKAKILLSTVDRTLLTVEDQFNSSNDVRLNVSKDLVDRCVNKLWNQSVFDEFEYFGNYLKFSTGNPTHFIFYGGSTRVPEIYRLFQSYFNVDILKTVNLDEGAVIGGGMIVYRSLDRHKTSNRFSSFDQTRPFFKYETKQLFRLNPNMNFSFYLSGKQFESLAVSLQHHEEEFAFINYTNIWESDEATGYRKKRTEYATTLENISWFSLKASTDVPIEAVFSSDDGKLNLTCQLEPLVKTLYDIMDPLDLKYVQYEGKSWINIRKRFILKKEIYRYSDYSTKLSEALARYQANFLGKHLQKVMLQLNFSTDAASVPHLDWAGLFVTSKKNFEEFKSQVDAGKNPKEAAYFDFYPLNFDCTYSFAKNFYLQEDQLMEYQQKIVYSNHLAHLSRQYMRMVNFIENISIRQLYNGLSSYFASNFEKLTEILRYSRHSDCKEHFCQDKLIHEGISVMFNIIEAQDETPYDQILLHEIQEFIYENNIFLKPAEQAVYSYEPQEMQEFTADNYRQFYWL